jgi:hypothetical protein
VNEISRDIPIAVADAGGKFTVRDLQVCGSGPGSRRAPVTGVTVEYKDVNATIRWSAVTAADSYVVRYGIQPDDLYNDYIVRNAIELTIHSLNKA